MIYVASSWRNPYYEGVVTGLYWVVTAARVGLNIWSVWDAVHVAKAKNMYNQDLRAQRASLDFNVEPYFAYTPYAPGAVKPTRCRIIV